MSGHSATAIMTLILGETTLPVAQLGPDFLILKEPAPPQTEIQGIINLTVDGVYGEIPVRLPRGIEAGNRRVVIGEIEAPVLSPFCRVVSPSKT